MTPDSFAFAPSGPSYTRQGTNRVTYIANEKEFAWIYQTIPAGYDYFQSGKSKKA